MTRLYGLQVANGFSSEARVFATLLGARDDRYDAHVLVHADGRNDSHVSRFEAAARCGITTYDTGWRANTAGVKLSPARLAVAGKYLWRARAIPDLARECSPDVIYSGQQHYDYRAARVVARRLDLPQIIHLHFIIGPWLKQVVLDGLLAVERVVTVSDFIRDEALRHGVPPERVTTVLNAIEVMPVVPADQRREVRRGIGLPEGAFVFGMVSRLDPSKGHIDAIAAFDRVAARAPDAWLVIAGKGTHEAAIRAAAARSPVTDRILFLGQRADVPLLLGSIDAFVHPSSDDPCPLAVLEALASGLPVIAYGQGGTVEMIDSGVNGLLAPLGDVGALADLLDEVHRDPATVERLGRSARQRIATDFRPADAGRKFADVVQSIG